MLRPVRMRALVALCWVPLGLVAFGGSAGRLQVVKKGERPMTGRITLARPWPLRL